MGNGRTLFFLLIFGLMAIQLLLSLIQVKRYQKAVREMTGKVILGIGHRKGLTSRGEILLLAYDRGSNRVVGCRSMKGFTIFATFKEKPELVGLSLHEARAVGRELDSREMGRYRRKHPYNPDVLSKKKGALIQAVEAVELRLKREKEADGDGDITQFSGEH